MWVDVFCALSSQLIFHVVDNVECACYRCLRMGVPCEFDPHANLRTTSCLTCILAKTKCEPSAIPLSKYIPGPASRRAFKKHAAADKKKKPDTLKSTATTIKRKRKETSPTPRKLPKRASSSRGRAQPRNIPVADSSRHSPEISTGDECSHVNLHWKDCREYQAKNEERFSTFEGRLSKHDEAISKNYDVLCRVEGLLQDLVQGNKNRREN